MFYIRDHLLSNQFDELLKLKEKQFLYAARELEKLIIEKNNAFYAFRLALELDDRGFKTSRLEQLVIKSRDPNYILRFARFIRRANIPRLQAAIIKQNSILHIAKFGCFIRNSNRVLIEDIIYKSQSAKAAYLFIKFVKSADINRLKHFILKSNRPRYLYTLATKLTNKEELDGIQDAIINSSSNLYVRLYARWIPSANIERLEDRIIQTHDITEMKRFARVIPSIRIEKLLLLL